MNMIMNRVSALSSRTVLIVMGIITVAAAIFWQALTFSGVPDPFTTNMSELSAVFSSGILVFREGLEAILVLSAVTATVSRKKEKNYTKGVTTGTCLGLIATVATWFIVVAILSGINAPELDIQAATGLLAIVVLLVVMNWFFHKIYWTGWITNHTKRGRKLVESAASQNTLSMFGGFILLGFTAIYREGFEVVLFLQQLRLKDGDTIVMTGVAIGLILTGIVAVLTFIAHERLPYKKMLVLTGVMLGAVLLVMVGESIQEMQQAHWIATTPLNLPIPSWMGMWFAVFPNVQCLLAQAAAAILVLGSYTVAQYKNVLRPAS